MFELDDDSNFSKLFELLKNKPTVDYFKKLRERIPQDIVEKAYYAIFFNRTTFSGIFRSGPIGGYSQKGKYKIDCRYNCERLIKDIEKLRILFKDRIIVSNEHANTFLNNIEDAALIYLDPPYYGQGKALYNKFMVPDEHLQLSKLLKDKNNWILSYDKCKEIKDLYESFCSFEDLECKYTINIEESKSRKKSKEYVIIPK